MELAIAIGLISAVIIGAKYFGILNGAPYLPTSSVTVQSIITSSTLIPGMRFVDLGSGDGRIVVAAAKAGAIAHGYEINPFLVARSRKIIKEDNFGKNAVIYQGSFWDINVHEYDVVAVYGITGIMPRLEEKLRKELRPGAKVISHGFQFPTWSGTHLGKIHIYIQE